MNYHELSQPTGFFPRGTLVWRAGPVGRFRLLRQWHPGIIIAWLVPYGHTALQNPPNAWQYVLI